MLVRQSIPPRPATSWAVRPFLWPCPAGEILTNARQRDAVARAVEALDAALSALDLGMAPDAVLTEVEAAMAALGELTGRSVREDVAEQIFRRFCVGK